LPIKIIEIFNLGFSSTIFEQALIASSWPFHLEYLAGRSITF